MSLKTRIQAGIQIKQTGSADLGQSNLDVPFAPEIALAHGTTTGKADKEFADHRTLAASATEDLDLAGGLTNSLGEATTFAKVKAILVVADEGNTNNVVVGGAAANAFLGPFADATDKIVIPPGGRALLVAPKNGWVVTAATGDILKVANSAGGTPVNYDVIVVGASA